jgi:hypothetical protein
MKKCLQNTSKSPWQYQSNHANQLSLKLEIQGVWERDSKASIDRSGISGLGSQLL